MRHSYYLGLILLGLSALSSTQAQGLPSRDSALERMIVVVPMIGAGTPDSPRRPLGMEQLTSLEETPIGYRYVLSDDGHFAIVELTARNFKHFQPMVNTFGAQARHTFDPKHHDKATVERELKLIRSDFNLNGFLSGSRWQGVKP